MVGLQFTVGTLPKPNYCDTDFGLQSFLFAAHNNFDIHREKLHGSYVGVRRYCLKEQGHTRRPCNPDGQFESDNQAEVRDTR